MNKRLAARDYPPELVEMYTRIGYVVKRVVRVTDARYTVTYRDEEGFTRRNVAIKTVLGMWIMLPHGACRAQT